jgi:hypothetical protein
VLQGPELILPPPVAVYKIITTNPGGVPFLATRPSSAESLSRVATGAFFRFFLCSF